MAQKLSVIVEDASKQDLVGATTTAPSRDTKQFVIMDTVIPVEAPQASYCVSVPRPKEAASAKVYFDDDDARYASVKVVLPKTYPQFVRDCVTAFYADRHDFVREKLEGLYAHAKADSLRFWVCHNDGSRSEIDYTSVLYSAVSYKPTLLLRCELRHAKQVQVRVSTAKTNQDAKGDSSQK